MFIFPVSEKPSLQKEVTYGKLCITLRFVVVFKLQKVLGKELVNKIYLPPPPPLLASAAHRSKAVVLLLLIRCLYELSLLGGIVHTERIQKMFIALSSCLILLESSSDRPLTFGTILKHKSATYDDQSVRFHMHFTMSLMLMLKGRSTLK